MGVLRVFMGFVRIGESAAEKEGGREEASETGSSRQRHRDRETDIQRGRHLDKQTKCSDKPLYRQE